MHPIHVLPGLISGGRRVSLGNELPVGQTVFGYTGIIQEYTIPDGMDSILISMWGSSGGKAAPGGFREPGRGGWGTMLVDVMPGDLLEIEVGQGGGAAEDNVAGGLGGWPDGGEGSRSNAAEGSGGGGSTRVRLNGIDLLIAGGGGGESGSSGTTGSGGQGGGTTGSIHSGTDDATMLPASQTAAGVNTVAGDSSGSGRQGGNAYVSGEDRFTNKGGTAAGGGGGGGYFGGAGYHGRGGGGGSGFHLPFADSNSPVDRTIYKSEGQGPSASQLMPHTQGWGYGYGARVSSADPVGTNGIDGVVVIFASSSATPAAVTLGPQNPVPDSITRADGTASVMRLKRYIVPCDMYIEEVQVYTDSLNDSNSVADNNTTPWIAVVYNSNSLNEPGSCLGRSAQITGLDTGNNIATLRFPVFVEKGKTVWVGYVAGTPTHTLTSHSVTLPSVEARTITSATYGESTVPSTVDNVSVNTSTTNYSIRAAGTTAVNEPDDYAIAVVPFTTPTSTGSVDLTTTDLGGRVPKAVYIVGGHATANAAVDHVVMAQGIAAHSGGLAQFATSGNIEDNQATSDADSEQRSGAIVSTAAPGEIAPTTQRLFAQVTAWITNGVTLNWTTVEAGAARQFFAIFIAGNTVDACAFLKGDWGAAALQNINRIGFRPTFVLTCGEFSNAGNGDGSNGLLAQGISLMAEDGTMGMMFIAQDNGVAEAGRPNTYISNANAFAYSGTSITVEDQFAGTIDDEGFDATNNVTLTACDQYMLAVRIRGAQATVKAFDVPTATGVQNVTGVGFQPEVALLMGTTNESYGSAYNTIDASGWGVGAYDSGGGVGLSFFNQHDGDPQNCGSAAGDNVFRVGRNTSATAISADWDGFTADGFDLDWTAVPATATKCLALCIGPA